MNWRLAENPYGNNYENYQFFDRETFLADIIINTKHVGYVEQVIFANGISLSLKKAIFLNIIQLMKPKVALIRALCFDSNEDLKFHEYLFKECGFTLLKRGGHFVWKPLHSGQVDAHGLFLTRLFTQGNQ